MESFSVKIGKFSLIGGLEWRTLAGVKLPEKEIEDYASDIGATYFVQVGNNVETTCGFFPDDRVDNEPPQKSYSIAAVLSGFPDISPDCVLVLETGDKALLVALRAGLPAPGFDGYGPIDDILDLAKKFIQMSSSGVTVYGNCERLSPVPLTLEDLIEKSTSLKSAKLRRVPRPWLRYSVICAGVLIVGGAGMYCYNFYQNQQKIRADMLAYVNPEKAYEQNVAKLFKAALPAKLNVPKLVGMLSATAVKNGGWDLAEIVCQKDGCTYVWKNGAGPGTNKSFVPPKLALSLKYSEKDDVILYQLAYPTPLDRGIEVSKILTLEEVLRDIIGDIYEVKGLGVVQTFTVPGKADFGLVEGVATPPKHAYKESAYSLTGPGDALDAIQLLPDVATLETVHLTLDVDKKLTFKIEGNYYVK